MMNNILEKGKGILQSAVLKMTQIQKPLLWIAVTYVFVLLLIIVVWISFWFIDYAQSGVANLQILLSFFNSMKDPTMVGCVTFILGLFTDRDHDGVLDINEGEYGGNNVQSNRH